MKKFQLRVGIDVDDVLFECVPHAIKLANEKYKYDPPLRIDEITAWGGVGGRGDVILEFFEDENFFKSQPVIKGAQEFIKKLSEQAEVFFITAMDPRFMSIRAKQLIETFPEVDPKNIIMGSRKDMIDVDILFDDAAHNILTTSAAYPVIMRQPWNSHLTGMLGVNNYDEFLHLMEVIQNSYSYGPVYKNEPSVIAMVGPSGSGKTAIVNELLKRDEFQRVVTCTTRAKREGESDNAYHFMTKEEFMKEKEAGKFFETSVYAEEFYGTKMEEITSILESGKHAIMPIDMSGAIAMKLHFPNCITFFVKRDKKSLLEQVIARTCPDTDKVNRIISIDSEQKNEELCDVTIDNTGSLENSINQVLKAVELI